MRNTDIIEETSGWPEPRANITMFPANVVKGSLFIAINERDGDGDTDTGAIYLTPGECEVLALALMRQAAWLRQNGE